jgi:hypothetical protein
MCVDFRYDAADEDLLRVVEILMHACIFFVA